MCILRFSSEASSLKEASDKVEEVFKVEVVDKEVEVVEDGVKDINLGIILPPLVATLMMALLAPAGHAVTRTRPVGKDFKVLLFPETIHVRNHKLCRHLAHLIQERKEV